MKKMNRKEARRLNRLEKKEREARDRKKRKWLNYLKKIVFYGVAVFVIGLSANWIYSKLTEPQTWTSIPIMPKYHLAPGQPSSFYNSDPPTSGPHTNNLARWGVHKEPIRKERQVHNLEDGGVLVHYKCPKGCPELVAKLRSIVKRFDRAILAPYPAMEKRIALTAWGKLDTFDEFDEDRVVRFIKAHMGVDHH